jgi:hypothetical protein
VAAVTAGGSPSVSSGSANTCFARIFGENTMRLTCVSSSETTAERPTSEPVPAVVGSATNQGTTSGIVRTFGWSHAYSSASPPAVPITPTIFATSSAAPPPNPTTLSARCARNAAAPALACATVGLPKMPSNTATSSPAARNGSTKPVATGSFASARSVTTSGRFRPWSRRCGPTSLAAPGPKWMVVGNAKRSMVIG